jgi:hypothetical protein
VKNIGLRFATVLFAVLTSLTTLQAQVTPPPAPQAVTTRVFRYDTRPPLGPDGIFLKGFHRDPTNSWNLSRHVAWDYASSSTVFISTTSNFNYAQRLGLAWWDSPENPNQRSPQQTYWIYEIVPDLNFVDVSATYFRTLAATDPTSRYYWALNEQRETFTRESEFAAIADIDNTRIARATLYNMEGQMLMTAQNELFNAAVTPAVHPNDFPLGQERGQYFGFDIGAATGGSSDGFVCNDTISETSQRKKRETDLNDPTVTGTAVDCLDVKQNLLAEMPVNTPAGFGSTMNLTPPVPPGDYRQWVDVDGDGLTDLCVLYVTGQPYPYVRCYRDTRPVPNAASTAPQLSADAGIFTTNMLVGTLAGNLGPSDSWSFVNVTGNPGDIAFCRVIQSTSSYKLLCGNFPKSATVAVTPVAVQSANLPGIYPGGGQWVSSLTGNGKPAFCFPTPKTITRTSANLMTCSVATGTGFAAPIQTSFTDLGVSGTQQWVDVLGDGTKAYCRWGQINGSLRCLTINKATGSFGTDIESVPLEANYPSPVQPQIWWADVDHDGKADFCRAASNYQASYVACTVSVKSPFDTEITSPYLDTGYLGTAAMVDIDGDGYPDFCRLTPASHVTSSAQPAKMSCLINDHNDFQTSIDSSSPYNISLDPGSVENGALDWLTANGQQTGQYCRFKAGNNLACFAIY